MIVTTLKLSVLFDRVRFLKYITHKRIFILFSIINFDQIPIFLSNRFLLGIDCFLLTMRNLYVFKTLTIVMKCVQGGNTLRYDKRNV